MQSESYAVLQSIVSSVFDGDTSLQAPRSWRASNRAELDTITEVTESYDTACTIFAASELTAICAGHCSCYRLKAPHHELFVQGSSKPCTSNTHPQGRRSQPSTEPEVAKQRSKLSPCTSLPHLWQLSTELRQLVGAEALHTSLEPDTLSVALIPWSDMQAQLVGGGSLQRRPANDEHDQNRRKENPCTPLELYELSSTQKLFEGARIHPQGVGEAHESTNPHTHTHTHTHARISVSGQ